VLADVEEGAGAGLVGAELAAEGGVEGDGCMRQEEGKGE